MIKNGIKIFKEELNKRIALKENSSLVDNEENNEDLEELEDNEVFEELCGNSCFSNISADASQEVFSSEEEEKENEDNLLLDQEPEKELSFELPEEEINEVTYYNILKR